MFLGCDDVMLPDYVARAHALLAAFPDADIFQPGRAGHRRRRAAGDAARRPGQGVAEAAHQRSAGSSRAKSSPPACSAATGSTGPRWCSAPKKVQRHAFRQDLPIILDLALVLDMVADGSALVLDPDVTFAYRRHATSLSGTSLERRQQVRPGPALLRRCGRADARDRWRSAEREARRRWTSRLHALTLLPAALHSREDRAGAVRQVLRHAVG